MLIWGTTWAAIRVGLASIPPFAGVALRFAIAAFSLDPVAVAALLYLALFGSAIAFSLYYWVLERIAATRLSLITLATPVVAVLVGTMVLDEPFSARAAIGAALVLTGVGVASRRSRTVPRRDPRV